LAQNAEGFAFSNKKGEMAIQDIQGAKYC